MKYFYSIVFLVCSIFFSNAQIVNIPDTSFKHILTTDNCVDLNNDGVGDSDVDSNNDGEIQVSEAEAVEYLVLDSATPEMTRILDLTGLVAFSNLKSFNATYVYFNELQNIGGIDQYVGVETIDFTSFSSMESIRIVDELSSVLTNIDVSGLTNLTDFHVRSVIPENNGDTPVPVAINLQGCDNLISLDLSNSFFDVDFCQVPSLESLRCLLLFDNNSDLDLSCLTNLSSLDVSLSQFNFLNLKNGSVLDSFSGFDTFGNIICIDDNQAEIDSLGNTINNFQNVTTTCDGFGGTNIVSGNILINTSSNNDICVTNEIMNPLRFDILQNNASVYDFLVTGANYFETPTGLDEGDFVIVPNVTFSNGFVVEPEEINVLFAANNGEIFQQDLCMQPRVEIVDGIEIKFFPHYIPTDPNINWFDAYIVLSNTNATSYTGKLQLKCDDDYTFPFEYGYPPNSESEDIVTWDSLTIGANNSFVIQLRVGYNSDTDPNFPVFAGDQLVYDLFLTNLGNGDIVPNGDSMPNFRMIQTIHPGEEVLNIDEIGNQNSEITVYPNPTNGIINITSHDIVDEVNLFSIDGQLIHSITKRYNHSELIQLDMTNLNQGIYFISVKTNSKVYTKKIIKK